MLEVEAWRRTIDEGRIDTYEAHLAAVTQVIQTVREQLCEPLTLEDMADIACLSPYYFSRVFHSIVGVPPGEYLSAMRLDAAKRLLLTTTLSITDICFEVGYTGLGSFSTRFAQLVGLSPRHLRHTAKNVAVPSQTVLCEGRTPLSSTPRENSLNGRIHTVSTFNGLIFIGLFPKPLPQGRPVRCTVLSAPGPFCIDSIPAGRYYVMVAAFPLSDDPQAFLLPPETQLVGIHGPLFVGNGILEMPVDIFLRPRRVTDPPVILALPFV
ncbi:MAG TPA: AraC family transcriptional regulator [Ktedonobacteraceae bacterium]|nr:AraC family transcriptional regulator [Ktedonobacteraceae bacterium]